MKPEYLTLKKVTLWCNEGYQYLIEITKKSETSEIALSIIGNDDDNFGEILFKNIESFEEWMNSIVKIVKEA
jgi:hypothetical protein